MRKLVAIPLALTAGLMLAVGPAMAASPSCSSSSVATIKALQGGGGNQTRLPDHICNTTPSKAAQSDLQAQGPTLSAKQLWPEKATHLRQRGISSDYQLPAPGA